MFLWLLVLDLSLARGHPGVETFTLKSTVKDLYQGTEAYPKIQIYFKLSPTFQAEYVKPTIHHGNLFYPVHIAEYEVTEREFNLTVQTTFNNSFESNFIGQKVDFFITVELAFTNSSRNKAIRVYETLPFSLTNVDKDPLLCKYSKFLYPPSCAYWTTNKGGPSSVTWSGPISFNNGYRGYAYKEHRYATVQFGKMTIVRKLDIIAYDQARRPTRVWVQRSLDGISFTDVELVHIDYSITWYGIGKLSVSSAMRAIGLRLSEYEPEASFSFDIYGCEATGVDADAYDPCDERVKNRNWEQRVILIVSESLMFYCDQSKSSLGKPYLVPHCFRLMVNSQGVTQIDDMGPQVASLLAYDTTKNLVLATGTQPSMQLFSRDNGLIWAVLPGGYRQNKSATLINATEVPFGPAETFRANADECGLHSSSSWRICYHGIFRGSTKIVDWANEC
ncbi:hypothetical protein Ciccas_009070 [Cichlidogyrus casuarinus]|uniref:F5/8 type C domain-containing protein n=1 Tax=Cichlidogyrus casuarinus TaxID=1844966 RepID=A0ABD2PY33_9PLAT